MTLVTCDGLACGGSGGSLARDFVYKVQPGSNGVWRVDVGVEDGDINHYVYGPNDRPANWSVSIVSVARSHDFVPTEHGVVTGKAGTCPYVLRFSGSQSSPLNSDFEVGFDYFHPGAGILHDVMWKTFSDNRQTNWSFEVGEPGGPVHSPVRMNYPVRYNVILIVLDDVGTDKLELFDKPSGHTHPFAYVPTLAGLAAGGVKFTNFYVNPLCSTTRACIQTGRYSYRHGIGTLADPIDPPGYIPPFDNPDFRLDDCEVTLGELLKLGFVNPGLAYSTGAFGKWHVTPHDWDPIDQHLDNVEHAKRNGYDRFYGTLTNTGNNYTWKKFKTGKLGTSEPTGMQDYPYPNDWPQAESQWTADVVRRDAVEWINSTATEPFFAYVAFNPPHSLLAWPPVWTGDTSPLSPRRLLSVGTENEVKTTPPPPASYNSAQQEILYRANIEAVDSEIGYLLADIGAKLDRTMVIVVGDNGTDDGSNENENPPGHLIRPPHNPNHGKSTLYQLGIRAPMIVSGPLASPGEECVAAVGAVDLFNTIAAITGADPADPDVAPCSGDRDSVNLLPLIENPSGSATRPAFSQSFAPNGPAGTGACFACFQNGRAVTDGHYKYIRRLRFSLGKPCNPCPVPWDPCPDPFPDPCDGDDVHEFYDVSVDFEEATNLYPLPSGSPLQGIYDSLSAYMDSLDF